MVPTWGYLCTEIYDDGGVGDLRPATAKAIRRQELAFSVSYVRLEKTTLALQGE